MSLSGSRSEPPPPERPSYWLHGLLLFLTLVTTTVVGAEHWLSFEANFSAAPAAVHVDVVARSTACGTP